MKMKKAIFLIVTLALILIPIMDVSAITLPWFTILTHNYSQGEKVVESEESSEVEVGKTLQLYGMTVYASTIYNGSEIVDSGTFVQYNNLSGITWSSSNTGIATVDNKGKVTGVAAGEATITAVYDGESKTHKVKVKSNTNKGIHFAVSTPETAKIVNKEYGFMILLNNIPDSEKKNISVKIDNENIAKLIGIDLCNYTDGSGSGMIIANTKLLSLGKTKITATLNYNGETYSANYDFEVIKSAYSLSLSAKDNANLPTNVSKGKKIQLAATLQVYGGSLLPEDVTDKGVIWESSNEKVATVDNKGLVTAIENGTVTITAKYKIDEETITTTYNLKVVDPPLIVDVPNTAAENTKYFYIIGFIMIILGIRTISNNLLIYKK